LSHGNILQNRLPFAYLQFREIIENTSLLEQASLLLVDDDVVFCRVLYRVLEKRGYALTVAHSMEVGAYQSRIA